MKNLLKKIWLVTTILLMMNSFNVCFAAITTSDLLNPTIESTANKNPAVITEGQDEFNAVQALPKLTIPEVVAGLIKNILRVTMLLTLIAILVTGVFFILARGDTEKTTKAKDAILYLIIGIAIMSASYAIVVGITKFKFLE